MGGRAWPGLYRQPKNTLSFGRGRVGREWLHGDGWEGDPPSRPQDPPLTSTPYDLTHPLGITLGLLGGVIFLVATQGQRVYLNPERCTALIY